MLNKLITGRWNERVLIVGTGDLAKSVGRYLCKHRRNGFEVVGFIDEDPTRIGESIVNPKVIGTPDQISSLVETLGIAKIIVALPERRGKLPVDDLLLCRVRGVEVVDGVSFYAGLTGKVPVEELRPAWLIFSQGFDRRKATLWIKQVLDVLCATAGLLLAAPLFLTIPLLIKLDSRGPVFYRQTRVGAGNKPFGLLKFRSMVTDAEADSGPVWAQEDDPRVTRVGRWLRKLRLDEIPQTINVLRGEMSFIGPRPERPEFIARLQAEIPFYAIRHTIKPGITGWAQVKYRYGATVEDTIEKLRYDLYYLKNMSLALDFKILVETVKIVLLGQGAR